MAKRTDRNWHQHNGLWLPEHPGALVPRGTGRLPATVREWGGGCFAGCCEGPEEVCYQECCLFRSASSPAVTPACFIDISITGFGSEDCGNSYTCDNRNYTGRLEYMPMLQQYPYWTCEAYHFLGDSTEVCKRTINDCTVWLNSWRGTFVKKACGKWGGPYTYPKEYKLCVEVIDYAYAGPYAQASVTAARWETPWFHFGDYEDWGKWIKTNSLAGYFSGGMTAYPIPPEQFPGGTTYAACGYEEFTVTLELVDETE